MFELSKRGALSSEPLRRLNEAISNLSAQELQWASGYLAGLAAAGGAQSAHPVDASVEQEMLTILYGSQTGTGRRIARDVELAAQAKRIANHAISMADFKTNQLKKLRKALFIVSTHGDGDPPDDAQDLYDYLLDDRAPRLEQLHYSVLALGDSSYANFCQTGREIDERLASLGANRLVDRVECDLDYEEGARAWTSQSVEKVCEEFGDTKASTYLRAVPDAPVHDRTNPYSAEVIVNQPIVGRGSSKEVHHIELSFEGSGLNYFPGDSLGVLPTNPTVLVDELLQVLGLDRDASLTIGARELGISQALSSHYEITKASRGFIEKYAELCASDELKGLLGDKQRAELAVFLKEHQIVDVLVQFPAKLNATQFVSTLRKLTPRLYSLASSIDANPDEAHLTVGVVDYLAFGRVHYGAASSYLANCEHTHLPVYVETNERFRLPADCNAPIIMVGPGTGVAPFRAFMQQRELEDATGKNWLFFGDRTFANDFLYQREWLRYRKTGLLNRLEVAFSRDQEDKHYVQHRMTACGREMYAWLEEGAYLYVCGDALRMASDVDKALIEIVAEHGGYDLDRAREYVAALRRDGRYLRDVY